MKINIRNSAVIWFKKRYSPENAVLFASKFYHPEESWSKSRVWFFQIPLAILYPNKNGFINLLCENPFKGDAFILVKVPVSFFLKNEKSFDKDKKQRVYRIYLSAEPIDFFKEVRKGSKLDFSGFIQNFQLSDLRLLYN